MSPLDKRKCSSSLFSISDVIVSSELTGKIDTSNWINQANIATPQFKRYSSLFNKDSDKK
jgi:hypothetical protein